MQAAIGSSLSIAVMIAASPALAVTTEVDWIDNFSIPFTFAIKQQNAGGINQPFDVMASGMATGIIPGFNSQDPRLGSLVGLPVSRTVTTNFNSNLSSATSVFGPSCNVFSPCPSDTLSQTARVTVSNVSLGASLTKAGFSSFNIPSLPPSVSRAGNYTLNSSAPSTFTSATSVNTGNYTFNINAEISAPPVINRSFPSVTGTVSGSIFGVVDTKVEIISSTSPPPSPYDFSPGVKQAAQAASYIFGIPGTTLNVAGSLGSEAAISAYEAANLYLSGGLAVGGFAANGGTGFNAQQQFASLAVSAGLLGGTVALGYAATPVAAGLASMSAVGVGLQSLAAVSQFIAEDPPDPNYMTVVRMTPAQISPSQLGATGIYANITADILNGISKVQADEVNLINDAQKHDGAVAAGDQIYAAIHAANYQADLAALQRDYADFSTLFQVYKGTIESDPSLDVTVDTQALTTSLQALAQYRTGSGLNDVLGILASWGLDPTLFGSDSVTGVLGNLELTSLNPSLFAALDSVAANVQSKDLGALFAPVQVPEPSTALLSASFVSYFLGLRFRKRRYECDEGC